MVEMLAKETFILDARHGESHIDLANFIVTHRQKLPDVMAYDQMCDAYNVILYLFTNLCTHRAFGSI
jgi:hypothetical protein